MKEKRKKIKLINKMNESKKALNKRKYRKKIFIWKRMKEQRKKENYEKALK